MHIFARAVCLSNFVPKTLLNGLERCLKLLKAFGRPQEAPESAENAPKTRPRRPKTPLRRSQEAPRRPQHSPRNECWFDFVGLGKC